MFLSIFFVSKDIVKIFSSNEAIFVIIRFKEDILYFLSAQRFLEFQGHLLKLFHINFTLNNKFLTLCVQSKELNILSICLRECELYTTPIERWMKSEKDKPWGCYPYKPFMILTTTLLAFESPKLTKAAFISLGSTYPLRSESNISKAALIPLTSSRVIVSLT